MSHLWSRKQFLRKQFLRKQFLRKRFLIGITLIVICIILAIAFIVAADKFSWTWTGFNGGYSKTTTTSTRHGTSTATEQPPEKTLWDWLQLLIVPVAISLVGLLFTQAQHNRDQHLAEKRAETEHEIATDNQRETALQDYISKLSELTLKDNLLNLSTKGKLNPECEKARKIARVLTLTTLRRLDAERKGNVLQFLQEAGLINKDEPIINLKGADFSGVNLSGTKLIGANLNFTNLSRANLVGAYLSGAKLSGAKLISANLRVVDLSRADLIGADLSGAILSFSDLRSSDLSGAILSFSNLRAANLSRANLSRANLIEANLSRADLSDAIITRSQWQEARSLQDVTLPDGTKL